MRAIPGTPIDAFEDGDKLKEECGVFGVIGVADAANFVALTPQITAAATWIGGQQVAA